MPYKADRTLGAKVKESVQRGKLMPAVVQEVYFDKVTVSLSGNGQLVRSLPIVGGPVSAGQKVNVDFSTKPPTVIAKGNAYMTADDLESALKRAGSGLIQPNTTLQITLFSGGSSVDTFVPTEIGLAAALDAAAEGDVVWLPDVDIALDVTVPDGVSLVGISSRQSIISGKVTLGLNSCLENLSVINAINTADEVNAVIAQGSGDDAWIKKCEIHAYNCGEGLAKAIKIGASTGSLYVQDSVVCADSKTGANAYAFSGAGGTCYVTHCKLYSKSSDHFDGTTFYEYSDIGHVSELTRMCFVPQSEMLQQLSTFNQGDRFRTNNADYFASPVVRTAYNRTDKAISRHGAFAQYEEHIYFETDEGTENRTLREFNLDAGTSKDIEVWTYGTSTSSLGWNYCVVTKRELYVVEGGMSGDAHVYVVNFETMDATEIYTLDRDQAAGDPEGQDGYRWVTQVQITPVLRDNGELYVVVAGTYNEYTDYATGKYKSGAIFWIKNYTQNSAWTKVTSSAAFLNPDTQEPNVNMSGLYCSTLAGRYVICTSDFQCDSGKAALGVWSIDLDTNVVSQEVLFNGTSYGGGASPTPVGIASSSKDNLTYIMYTGDYAYSGVTLNVIYKYDPATNTFAVHHRNTVAQTWYMLVNNTEVFLMYFQSGSNYNFLELSGKTVILSNTTLPAGSYDKLIGDNLNMPFYEQATGLLRLLNIDTGAVQTMDIDKEADTDTASIQVRTIGDGYMIVSSKYISFGVYNSNRFTVRDS